MTLRFGWEWESAPDVRTPELAATWSRLSIEIAGVTATLVEERGSGHGVRKSIDVPTYPLAEWLAFNWWSIFAPRARGGGEFRLVGAADGFPWPDLTLVAGPGYVSASLERMDKEPYFVRFLSSVDAVLDPSATSYELAQFIDATVRRLDEAGLAETPLHQEWDAITTANLSERQFCLAAAALGLDPYSLGDDEEERILGLNQLGMDSPLALDLASSVNLDGLSEAQDWVAEALGRVLVEQELNFAPAVEQLPFGESIRPWLVGYDRARRLRAARSMDPVQKLELTDLVETTIMGSTAPPSIGGLVGASTHGTTVAVGLDVSASARRFIAARAIGRRTFDGRTGGILLTNTRRRYAEKIERAFAAELLAPADGVAELLGGDYSDFAMAQVAQRYEVDTRVIEHQVENQLTS